MHRYFVRGRQQDDRDAQVDSGARQWQQSASDAYADIVQAPEEGRCGELQHNSSDIYANIVEAPAKELCGELQQQELVANESACSEDSDIHAADPPPACFMCLVCESTITATTSREHESSTMHIFHQKLQSGTSTAPKANLHLTETNAGYRILSKLGWTQDTGLGPSHKQGRLEPIKTVFKQDRTGLGAVKQVPRAAVASASSNDTEKFLTRKQLERLKERERRKEAHWRWELGAAADNVPEGYEGLLKRAPPQRQKGRGKRHKR